MPRVTCCMDWAGSASFTLNRATWRKPSIERSTSVGKVAFQVEPIQIRSEILALARRVEALEPRTILENGTARGGTLFIWCQLASRQVIACDLAIR